MKHLRLVVVLSALLAWLTFSLFFLNSALHNDSIPMVIVLYAVAVFFASLLVWLLEQRSTHTHML